MDKDIEAVRLFKLAAKQGNADAQCDLGVCYKSGGGVKEDAEEAVRWFKLAAKKGHIEAWCLLQERRWSEERQKKGIAMVQTSC